MRDVQPTAPSNDPSWSVIARAAAGDPAARSKFASTCLPVIRSFLDLRWRSTPLAHEVEDAVQEVFVECLRSQGVLSRADPSRGDISGLLYGVACNVAKRFEQHASERNGRAEGSVSAFADLPAREASLSVQFDRVWALAMVREAGELMRVRAARGTTGEQQRVELLKLRFAGGLPIREIATQWNVEPEVVHRSYRKAREEFRACLRDVLGELSLRPEGVREEEIARILVLLG
jgi:RNA polymerase sigma factor (sigma-70 family)